YARRTARHCTPFPLRCSTAPPDAGRPPAGVNGSGTPTHASGRPCPSRSPDPRARTPQAQNQVRWRHVRLVTIVHHRVRPSPFREGIVIDVARSEGIAEEECMRPGGFRLPHQWTLTAPAVLVSVCGSTGAAP